MISCVCHLLCYLSIVFGIVDFLLVWLLFLIVFDVLCFEVFVVVGCCYGVPDWLCCLLFLYLLCLFGVFGLGCLIWVGLFDCDLRCRL